MGALNCKDLFRHRTHEIRLSEYGEGDSYTLECEDCGEVLVEFHDNDRGDLEFGPPPQEDDGECHCALCRVGVGVDVNNK